MRASQPRGFALVGAVFALVVIASLIGGAFFAAMMEVNMGRSHQEYRRSFSAAEGGLATRIALWQQNGASLNALAVGDSMVFVDTMPDRRSVATTSVRRLNGQLYLLRALGASGTSYRLHGAIAKLQVARLDIRASLTTRAGLRIGGSSFINGKNTDPTNWGCPPVSDTLPAVRTPDSNMISTSGCTNFSCISGNPKIQQDPSVGDSTFFNYGGLTWNDLIAMATRTYYGSTGPLNNIAPIASGGICNVGASSNWGEPWHGAGQIEACYGYFPIIYVNGNLHLTGGRGQGILLVDGDLAVEGGFEFYGPVIVKGHFQTQGTGGHFNGGVLSADVDLELNSVLGNAVITYSSCAIQRAVQASATARLLKERSWMDLMQ